MPIDPTFKLMADQQAGASPSLEERGMTGARDELERVFARLTRRAVDDMARVETHVAPGPRGDIALRLFVPESNLDEDADPALLVYLHGGSFCIGSLDTHDQLCRALAKRSGCAVASVDYGLAPEHPFPAGFDDAYAAFRWLCEHAAELGCDATRIAIGGDSAGGTLAASCAIRARDDGGQRPLLQLLLYPGPDPYGDHASQRDFGEGYLYTQTMRRWFYSHYESEDCDRFDWRIAPLRAESHANLPPALVVSAEFDPLRDEGEAFATALSAAGVDVWHKRYPGMVHGFLQYFPIARAARRALDEVAGELRLRLAPG